MKRAKRSFNRHPKGFTPLRRYLSEPTRVRRWMKDGASGILTGEFGRVESFRFVESVCPIGGNIE